MSESTDRVAVMEKIKTELNSVTHAIPGLEHLANTGVLPQWRLIEAQTKFFDAGDRLATLASHGNKFSPTEKAQLNALFKVSNILNAKLIKVHERRESMAANARTTLMDLMIAEEKEQMLTDNLDQARTSGTKESPSKPSTSPLKSIHRCLPIRQPSPPQCSQALCKAALRNEVKQQQKKLASSTKGHQNLQDSEDVLTTKNRGYSQTLHQFPKIEKTKVDGAQSPLLVEKTKVVAKLKQLKAEMSAKAAGKVLEQDVFFDAATKMHESNAEEIVHDSTEATGLHNSCDDDAIGSMHDGEVSCTEPELPAFHYSADDFPAIGSFNPKWAFGVDPGFGASKDEDSDSFAVMNGEEDDGGAALQQMEYPGHVAPQGDQDRLEKVLGTSHVTIDQSIEAFVDANEQLVVDANDLDAAVAEESDDGAGDFEEEGDEDSEEVEGEKFDEDSPNEEEDEAAYEAVDLSSKEPTTKGKSADLEDDDFVLVEADEAIGAPEQPWSPNERTRARACVVM
ncbi:hypothetical protein FKW77_006236 [Venturia effusa]|uniref:Uncharacterized protein n=1 Tax=Venturia effusa TaxID=50376 RepID=A0A517LAY6_9PEZI|nr:hypothetical protein FKW77_006236 [Venturia effusa]